MNLLRTQVKDAAGLVVLESYGLNGLSNDERARRIVKLKEQDRYIFPKDAQVFCIDPASCS